MFDNVIIQQLQLSLIILTVSLIQNYNTAKPLLKFYRFAWFLVMFKCFMPFAFTIYIPVTSATMPFSSLSTVTVVDIVKPYLMIISILLAIFYMSAYVYSYIIFKKHAIKVDVYRNISVYQSSYIRSACVIGIIKQRIIIPSHYYTCCSFDELNIVLAHEYQHIKSHDNFIRFLCLFLVILYWWNPFIWLMRNSLCTLLEYACDNRVTRTLNEKKYAKLLIKLEEVKLYTLSSFTMAPLKNRVLLLQNGSKMSRKSKCVIVFMVIVSLCNIFSFIPVHDTMYEKYIDTNATNTQIQDVQASLIDNDSTFDAGY